MGDSPQKLPKVFNLPANPFNILATVAVVSLRGINITTEIHQSRVLSTTIHLKTVEGNQHCGQCGIIFGHGHMLFSRTPKKFTYVKPIPTTATPKTEAKVLSGNDFFEKTDCRCKSAGLLDKCCQRKRTSPDGFGTFETV